MCAMQYMRASLGGGEAILRVKRSFVPLLVHPGPEYLLYLVRTLEALHGTSLRVHLSSLLGQPRYILCC